MNWQLYRKRMLFSYLLIYIGLPQPWRARTYNSRVFHWRFATKSTVISAVNKKESVNGISMHASQILRFIFKVLQCKLTQSHYIRKPNEPQYQEHTFLQESSWVTDLEKCFMWTQTSQLIILSRNNIDNRKTDFPLSESNENTLFATLCCLWSPREFELLNGRSFYTFLLVQKPHVTK